jgi:hypothetical protein
LAVLSFCFLLTLRRFWMSSSSEEGINTMFEIFCVWFIGEILFGDYLAFLLLLLGVDMVFGDNIPFPLRVCLWIRSSIISTLFKSTLTMPFNFSVRSTLVWIGKNCKINMVRYTCFSVLTCLGYYIYLDVVNEIINTWANPVIVHLKHMHSSSLFLHKHTKPLMSQYICRIFVYFNMIYLNKAHEIIKSWANQRYFGSKLRQQCLLIFLDVKYNHKWLKIWNILNKNNKNIQLPYQLLK